MVVLVRVNREADHDGTQERRLGQFNALVSKIIADWLQQPMLDAEPNYTI